MLTEFFDERSTWRIIVINMEPMAQMAEALGDENVSAVSCRQSCGMPSETQL